MPSWDVDCRVCCNGAPAQQRAAAGIASNAARIASNAETTTSSHNEEKNRLPSVVYVPWQVPGRCCGVVEYVDRIQHIISYEVHNRTGTRCAQHIVAHPGLMWLHDPNVAKSFFHTRECKNVDVACSFAFWVLET